jgi:drug/metabolite transporter (DMT)-like permease
MNSRLTGGIARALPAATISGVAVFVNGYGVRAVPDPTVYTTAKNLVTAAVLVVLLAAVVADRPIAHPVAARRPQWTMLAAVAVIGGSVPFVLFFEGLARASSTHAAFVQKTLVVWVAALAVPLLGERLRPLHVAAMAMIVGGLVALDGGLAGFRFGDGELLVLAATALWAVETVIAKRLLAGTPPLTVAAARMGGGVVLLVGWLAATGRLHALQHLGARGWLWSAATGAILAGYVVTWYAALARSGAIEVTAILTVGAVITAALSTVVKGTGLSATGLAGLALVAAGAALVAAMALGATRRRLGPAVP